MASRELDPWALTGAVRRRSQVADGM